MKKILLFSLFFLLAGFVIMFGYSTFAYYRALHADDPIVPYVFVERGTLTLVRGDDAYDLTATEKIPLKEKDILITKAASLAVVYWPDHSETRLDAFSRMTIERMQVERGYRTIQIEAKLENGKAWTQVVRTIYPDSYFRFHLPQGGIIAGVRGTVFDINLDKKYIHSVDHSVALSDGQGQSTLLLPGELVSTQNILEKLSRALIDTTWSSWNTLRDQTQSNVRTLRNTQYLETLTGASSGIEKLWDSIVSSILSWIPGFGDIPLYQGLERGSILQNIPTEKLLELYQKFQDTKFVQERDRIRAFVASTGLSDLPNAPAYIEHLAQTSLWDELTFTGMTLSGSEALFRSYRDNLTTQMKNVLDVVPLRDLEKKAKETMRQFLQ